MVPEHDERPLEPGEERAQLGLPARMRDEVARHAHDVGTPVGDPGDGDGGRSVPARQPRAQMEVGEMADAEPVERLRQARDRHVEHTHPGPPRLEPAVDDREAGTNGEHDDGHERDRHSGTLEG